MIVPISEMSTGLGKVFLLFQFSGSEHTRQKIRLSLIIDAAALAIDMTPNTNGAKIRARRLQMKMSLDDVAQGIDVPLARIDAIEQGIRVPNGSELRAICRYLLITAAYLSGDKSLVELVETDYADTDRMVAVLSERFRALPNQTYRQVAYEQIKEILDGMS